MSIRLPSRARILLIRRDNIGDLACTTPAINAIRINYPLASIAVLTNSYNVGVLSGNKSVDFVFSYEKIKHTAGIFSSIRAIIFRALLIIRLRLWKPDVIILAKSSFERHGLNTALLIGSPTIIGFVPNDAPYAGRYPNVRLETPMFDQIHEVEAVNKLLEPIGILCENYPIKVYPDPQTVHKLKSVLPFAQRRVALHISAREKSRKWALENYIGLVNHILNQDTSAQVLLFWSPGTANNVMHPGDDEMANEICMALSGSRIIPVPTNNLDELIAGLECADIFIGADGGAMHLATGLGKMVVAMFENLPDKINHWRPWMVKSRIVCSDSYECTNISCIDLDKVKKAYDDLIASNEV